MSFFHANRVFVAALMFLAGGVRAEQSVAVLDLKFIEDTGEPGVYLCLGNDECSVYGTVYVFEAKVQKLISGNLPRQPFLLVYSQHALKKESFDDVVALVERRTADSVSTAGYKMVQWGRKRNLFCFAPKEGTRDSDTVELPDGDKLSCYEPAERNQ